MPANLVTFSAQRTVPGAGWSGADFGPIAADALDDEVLASTPRMPTAADIASILLAAQEKG